MFKRLSAIIGVISTGLAAWPAWADGSGAQRLGTGVPTAIAVSPDGASLAVGTRLGVWFLSASTLAPLNFWDAGQWAPAVAYRADGRYLRAGDQFYDTTTNAAAPLAPADLAWQPLSPAPAHDCAPDGRRCLVYNLDNVIIRDTDTQIDTALLRTGLLLGAAWAPDERTIYTAVYGGVQAWDTATPTLRQSQTDFFTGSLFSGVHWSADSARVGSAERAWDIATGQAAAGRVCDTETAPVDCSGPRACLPDPMGVLMLDNRNAKTWTWRELEPHDTGTTAAALSTAGTRLVTSGRDLAHFPCPGRRGQQCQDVIGMTRGWDAQTFQRLGQIPVQFYSVALSPDGQLVVGQTVNGIEVWDWAAGRRLWADAEPAGAAGEFDSSLWHGSGLNWSHALAVSPDGQHVAAYANQTSNTAVSLWRVATGERVATLTGPTAPAPLLAGRLRDIHGSLWWRGVGLRGLAASSLDGTVVWPVP